MAVGQQLKSLVDQMPDPDKRGMYTTDIDKQKIERAIAAIHEGGRENVLGLIDMLGEPGSEQDVKPRYALHCLTNHVLIAKDEQGRKQLCEVLASQLGGSRTQAVQAYLCQELGWAGRRESVAALGKLLTDQQLSGPAAIALTNIRDDAAAEFRAAWPKATGRAKQSIMDGLAALADSQSVDIFKTALDDKDREVRIAASAGLASLGQVDSAERLIKAADAASGWERTQATKNCLVLAEKLATAGNAGAAKRIYEHLRQSRTEKTETHILEAAQRGLAAIEK